jgi:tRNA threonylcarbamoyladenosine biosynthesis protein TsaB
MARILALDTSTEACSCALNLEGEILEDFAVIPRQHAQSILPMIRSLLAAHGLGFRDLDAIAWGRGPGSFTGLRIAAGVTQGIAFAAALPVVPVSTLAALALQHHQLAGDTAIFACIDARIDEVYWAAYHVRDGEPELVGEEQLTMPENLPEAFLRHTFNGGSFAAAGPGLVYKARFPAGLREALGRQSPELLPRAGAIARLAATAFSRGAVVSADAAQPLYLRDKVTHS